MSKRDTTQQKTPQNGGRKHQPLALPGTPEYDRIAARAFELWQMRGCPIGSPEEDWIRAEEELQRKPEQQEQHVKPLTRTA